MTDTAEAEQACGCAYCYGQGADYPPISKPGLDCRRERILAYGEVQRQAGRDEELVRWTRMRRAVLEQTRNISAAHQAIVGTVTRLR